MTPVLLALNVAVFVVFTLASKTSPLHPTSDALLRWGANFGPSTLAGQWWRLLSCVFLHFGIVHLALNMFCLWTLGELAERLYGPIALVSLYLIAGITGAVATLAWHPLAVSAGASGAIFGVAGALIVSSAVGHSQLPQRHRMITLASLLAFAGYNLIYGLMTPGVGNAAHLGGLLAGIIAGVLLPAVRLRGTLAIFAVALLLACLGVFHAKSYVVHEERGRTLLAAGKSRAAIKELEEAVRQKPTAAEACFLLGQAYMESSQFAAAESSYRETLALNPAADAAFYQLGMAITLQGRAVQAMAMFRERELRDPANRVAPVGLGVAAMANGDFEVALAAFQRAAKLDPYNFSVLRQAGVVAMHLQRYGEAIDAFSKAVQLQPRNREAMDKLAQAYRANGMPNEADAVYRRGKGY